MAGYHEIARPYPAHKGNPGITHKVVEPQDFPGAQIDSLTMRDQKGHLVGVLCRYPDLPPYEKAGNITIWVNPHRLREGVATALLGDALSRWDNINLTDQHYTVAGRALVVSYIEAQAA